MTHIPMNQKHIRACERIECLDGEPVVGRPCRLRLWCGDRYALGEIRIETKNTVYCGRYAQEEVYA